MKKILINVLIIFCIQLFCASCVSKLSRVATGYDAKLMCSGVFVSDRNPEDIEKNDLLLTKAFPVTTEIDRERKQVVATISGAYYNRAVYREGLGCTLVVDATQEELDAQAAVAHTPAPALPESILWPDGRAVDFASLPPELDKAKLDEAVEYAFAEPGPYRNMGTRAVVVVYKGRLVAERYAPGFSKDTLQVGWSMTKSVTNALVGILVKQGKLDIHAPAPVPEWKDPTDPRSQITLDQLMRMSSGLKWAEDSITSNIIRMMYLESDTGAYAASMPLAFPPDSKWYYSSGTTNIISRIVRQAVGGSMADYFSFPYRELFDKLGMDSAVLEPDASGTFVGSSYLYATPRDWARFGLLYLQDGVWKGERILPEGWVAYSATPTPKAPRGGYGAQFWLNAGSPENREDRWMPGLPTNIYAARGMYGQFVSIIPSHHLIVVRMGITPYHTKNWDHLQFLKFIMEAVNN